MSNLNKIEHYSFGSMKINSREYQKDLIVFSDKILSGWWRREGHSLSIEDLKEVLNYKPDILIVGKGSSGMMSIPKSTKESLRERGIELVSENTDKAVESFNEHIEKGKKVVGAFHLTC